MKDKLDLYKSFKPKEDFKERGKQLGKDLKKIQEENIIQFLIGFIEECNITNITIN